MNNSCSNLTTPEYMVLFEEALRQAVLEYGDNIDQVMAKIKLFTDNLSENESTLFNEQISFILNYSDNTIN